MNKVFRVIWSEARNAYVVVSEMAKSHGTKSCSTKKLLAMLIAAGIMTCASAAPVMAKDVHVHLAKDATKIAIGKGAEANGDECVAIGNEAKANVGDSVAIGDKAEATGDDSVAIGDDAKAYGEDSVAIGEEAKATAKSSIALGENSVANRESGVVGAFAPEGADSLTWKANAGAVSVGSAIDDEDDEDDDRITRQIINVAAGTEDTDAVNVAQLKAATEGIAGKHTTVSVDGNIEGATYSGDGNLQVAEITDANGGKQYDLRLNKDIKLDSVTTGQTVMNKDGLKVGDNVSVTATAVTAGKTSISDEGVKVGEKTYISDKGLNANSQQITGVADGKVEAGSKDAINGSQLHNTNENIGDLKYSTVGKGDIADGDSTTTAIGKLDQKLNDIKATANQGWNLSTNGVATSASKVAPGETVDFSGDKNISVSHDGTNVKVELKKDINLDSVTTGQTVMNNDGLKVGDNVSVTATAVTAGKTSISDEGVKVGDNTYISADGLNANNNKVTNVADGNVEKDSKDAINGGQLHQTNENVAALDTRVTQNAKDIATNAKDIATNKADIATNKADIATNRNRINQLGSRVNKVGAGAAALAALHPMDFDPDDKWSFAAGMGNYAGQNAAAIGAFYRPDEKVMFSVGGTVGNGENMVNAGISFALDRTNHVSNSRTALAREVIDLRGQLAEMGAKMAKMEKAFGMLDETKTKLFPDIPANHWAYEYIAKLAGNGYLEGYPDGNFGGDRLMTRYEYAAMLYRAIENGAALEEKIIKEFEPELGRIRVDRISGEDGDRDKIERVRVNAVKGERDHYGNKIAKAEAKAK